MTTRISRQRLDSGYDVGVLKKTADELLSKMSDESVSAIVKILVSSHIQKEREIIAEFVKSRLGVKLSSLSNGDNSHLACYIKDGSYK